MITAYLKQFEVYIWAGVAVLVLIGAMYEVHVQREIGRNEVVAADAAARADERAKIAKEQVAVQAKADAAEVAREASDQKFNAYMSAHPVGSIIVCHQPSNQPGGLRPASSPNGADAGAGSGPPVVPTVSAGGVDIGPRTGVIVRAAGKMAELYRQYQQQPEVKQP